MTLPLLALLGCLPEPEAPRPVHTIYDGEPAAWAARSPANGMAAAVARWEAQAPGGLPSAVGPATFAGGT